MALAVESEIGRLEQVILHRPGDEMKRLTPQNKDDLLFDDILWLAEAQEEHDNSQTYCAHVASKYFICKICWPNR